MKLVFTLAFALSLQFSFAQTSLPLYYAQKDSASVKTPVSPETLMAHKMEMAHPSSSFKTNFAADTLAASKLKIAKESATFKPNIAPDSLVVNMMKAQLTGSADFQPCNNPTVIVCGQTIYNQDNYGVSQASPNFWTSNFSGADFENCLPCTNCYDGPDRVFRFTLDFGATVDIHMENVSGSDLDMFLLTSCSPANCYAYSWNAGGSNEDISTYLNPGTYYIVVDGFFGAQGLFDMSLYFEGGCTKPCDNATPIACGQTLSFQNNKTSSGWVNNFDAFDYSDCGTPFYNYLAPDRLYQFELQSETQVTIVLDIINQSIDLDLFLMSSCTPTVCYDKSINSTHFEDELIIATLPAGVYYIIVDGYNYAEGDYHLSLQCGCNNPTTLNCGPILTGQTTAGQPNNYSANTYSACGIPSGAPYGGPDKLYTFTLNQPEEVNISMEVLTAGANLDLFLLSSCAPAVCYAYSNNTAPFESIQAFLPAGTYFVIVDGYNGAQGSFNIQLSCNCNCIEPLDLGVLQSCESFEGFANNTLVSPNSVRWNKWSTTSGDAFVRTASGNKYLEMKPAGTPTPDVWYNLSSNTSGRYRLSYQMLVETGKNALYSVQHQEPNASGANSNTAYRVLFNADGSGFLRMGLSNTNTASFQYPNGGWVNVVQIIDMNLDVAELWIDGDFVHSWKFSLGSNGTLLKLESLRFEAADATFSYRVDNICFRSQGSCNIPPTIAPVCIENGTQVNNMVAAKCKLYTEDETQRCSDVCEFGGRFIYRGDNFSGSFDASDRAPTSVTTQPCVLQAYGNNLPPKLYADIYIFSREDNKDIVINFNNNGNPNVRAFVFVCNSDQDENGSCEDGEVCWQVLNSGGGNGSTLINTCHEFYYVVITGTLGETYSNLNIIPTGNCPPNPDLITCGATVSGTVGSNPPSVPFNSSTTYLQCYNGARPYTGDESFYKLVLDQPNKVTINLTASGPNPSPMGVFLFSFLCGGNCIGYAENSAVNPAAKLEANLNEGTYYLVVDKATNVGNPNFSLNVNCENYPFLVTYDAFTGDLNCPTDAVAPPHTVSLKSSPNFVSTDYIEFYFKDTDGGLKNNLESNQYWHNSAQPQLFNLRKDDQAGDLVKCSYVQGDTFFVFMHQADNNGTFKQFKPTFAPATGGGVTDSLKFRPGGFSFITKLTEINAINFVPEFSTISVPSNAIIRTMMFSSGEPWSVEKVNGPANWLSITPTPNNYTTTQKLTFTFEDNPSVQPRSVVLRFFPTQNSGFYQQFVLITQYGKCIIPQPVNIVTANTSICAGTTITLSADVGSSNVDLYDYQWSNGSTNTSITVTPLVPTTYTVTVIKKNCGEISEDSQPIQVTPAPNPPTPINAFICQGQGNVQSVSVVPQSGVQVLWYSQSTGGTPLSPTPSNSYTPIPQPTVTTTYYAEGSQNGCKSPSRSPVTLNVNPKPVFVTTDTICSANLQTYTVVTTVLNGNTVTSTPTFPVSFNPLNGAYTISGVPKGTSVTLTVTNTNTTCSNTKFVTSPICQCNSVNAPTTNNPQDYCPGETPPPLTASVGNGEIAEWYSGPSTPSPISTGAVFQPTGPGVFWVQSRNTATQCVSPRIAVQEILLAKPTFIILEKTCSAGLNNYTVRFNTNASAVIAPPYPVTNLTGGNFEIANVPINQSVNIHMVDGTTNCQRDTLVPTAACGCPADMPKPTTNTPLVSVCDGTVNIPALTVSVPNGMSANWYRNGQLQAGSPTITLQATTAGDYWAKTINTLNQCESHDSTKVTLQYKPLPTLGVADKACDASWQNYQVIVSSNTANLSAVPNIMPTNNGNNTYTFSGISIVSPISITATGANGCTQNINVDPPPCTCTILPAAPQNPNNPSICLGTPIPVLSVSVNNPGTETVDWYDAATGGNLLPNPSPVKTQYLPTSALTTTDYYAQARLIQNDCPSLTRTKVTLRVDQPATSYAGADATICASQVTSLSGSIGGSASTGTWSAIPLGGTFSPSSGFLQAQTYTPPQNFQGGTITISLTAFPTQPSVCPSNTDKMLLTVNPLPEINLISEDCEPNLDFYGIRFNTDADDIQFTPNVGIFNLNPDNSYTYGHVPEGVAVAITANFVSTGCTRTLTPVAKLCNCVNVVPKPTWLGDKKVCEGVTQYPTLEVSVGNGITVDWYDSITGGTLIRPNDATFDSPPGPGSYWAEAREIGTSCVSTERTLVKLEVAPNPVADAGLDQQSCPGTGTLTLTAAQNGIVDSYSWSNGQVGPIITVPIQNATYILTVALGDCTDKDTVSVSVLPGITAINFDHTNIHCNGGNDGALTSIPVGGIPPYTYSWSNSQTGATISSLLVGTYTVTITSQGCSITSSATVTQPLPIAVANATVQNATNFLNNGSIAVEMTGGTMPYHYQWLNLDNTPIGGATDSLVVSLYGPFSYKVRVIDANGCTFISNPIFVDNTTVGTNEPTLASQIEVFPNPSPGKFYLRFNLQQSDAAQIEAFDMLGRLLILERKQVAPGDVLELDLSDMPSSIYLLKINMESGGVMTKNISVKK